MLVPEQVAAPRVATIAVVALKLVAVELVNRIPPSSSVIGRVTLDLVNGMTETSLPPPSCRNGENTAMLRAPPRDHERGPSSLSHHQNPCHLG